MSTENYKTDQAQTGQFSINDEFAGISMHRLSSSLANTTSEVKVPLHPSVNSYAKRVVDVVGALSLLSISLPLFIVTAFIVKVTSVGPVLYRGRRLGMYGEPFSILKFRSMVKVASTMEDGLLADTDEIFFKPSDDWRITTVGHILRRYSIDELPQLFNVLKGEMSLVGPRPILSQEAERLPAGLRDPRFTVLPGLTCLWQVNGRSNLSNADRIRYDQEYVDNWSIMMDFKILLRTIPVVIFGTGAR